MESMPDILKKTNYDQNIEPNFNIVIDRHKHRMQIRIKWLVISRSVNEYFDEVIHIILSDLRNLLIKWAVDDNTTFEQSIVEFAEFHNMMVTYLDSGVLPLEKSQIKLMIKSSKNLMDEIKKFENSKNKLVQIELKLDLITRTCKIENIVKY